MLGDLLRKNFPLRRCFICFSPGHFRARPVMREVLEPKTKSVAVGTTFKTHDVPEDTHFFRLAVGRKSHDLVLVPKFQKSQILCHRGVKQTERMRKGHRAVDPHLIASSGAPHCARKIADRKRKARRLVRTAKRKSCSPDAPGDARRGETLPQFVLDRLQTPPPALQVSR